MKKLFYLITAAAMMASFTSCGKIDQENTPVDDPAIEAPSADGTTTLTISTSVEPQTKTYLNGGSVKWVSGDLITLFAEDGTSAKSDAVSSPASDYNFTFQNWPNDKTPKYALAVGPQSYYDLYVVSYEAGLINATLRTSQLLYHKNSFSKLANIGVGEVKYSDENGIYSAYMKNLCGLIKFRVAGDNVARVRISDTNSNPMTGVVKIEIDENGEPRVSELGGKSYSYVEITATESDNLNNKTGMLPAGADIYACVLPGEYRVKVESYAKDGTLLNTITLPEGATMKVQRNVIEEIAVDVDTYKKPSAGDSEEGGDDPVTPPTTDEDLVFEFDFSDWPFSPVLKVGSTSSLIKEKSSYSYNYNGVSYALEIFAPDTGYYYTGSALRFNSTGGGYITTPIVPDMRLSQVSVTINNGSGTKDISVSPNADGTEELAKISPNVSNKTASTILENTVDGKSYYLYTESNHAQLSKIVLTYTK